jgi:phosphoglycerol transferase
MLAALGCEIEGDHLGLGVNLFSGEQTLSEQYGYDYLFQELRKQSATYNKLMLSAE